MKVLIGAIGTEPESLLPSLRTEQPDLAYVVWYGPGKIRRAMSIVRKRFAAAEVDVHVHELRDGYAFEKTAEDLFRLAEPHQKDELVFDITGGTKVMAIAGFTVAWTLRARVVYNDETKDKGREHLELPVAALFRVPRPTATRRAVLNALQSAKEPISLAEVSDAVTKTVRRGESVIHHHVTGLITAGVAERVVNDADRRKVRYQLTPAGRVHAVASRAVDA